MESKLSEVRELIKKLDICENNMKCISISEDFWEKYENGDLEYFVLFAELKKESQELTSQIESYLK